MPLLTKQLKETGFAKPATGGNYLNPSQVSEGDKLRFTILGDDSLVGYQCWVDGEGGKRVALRFKDEPDASDIVERAEEIGATVPKDAAPRKFMAFAVWNYDLSRIQIFQFTQNSIATPLIAYLSEEEIEQEPHTYDFVLSATGSGMDKRYSVTALPGRRRKPNINEEVSAKWMAAIEGGFDLSMLLTGEDPFKGLKD